jgi:arsenical-resistance protein 2
MAGESADSVGSSTGRGGRAAAWFQDEIDRRGDTSMDSVTLVGGIKGWAKGGDEFLMFMDGYVAEEWANL